MSNPEQVDAPSSDPQSSGQWSIEKFRIEMAEARDEFDDALRRSGEALAEADAALQLVPR